jgi:LuxR family maltose regulon positive regulatory protein
VPDAPPVHVNRQRLTDILDAATRAPLTLVTAPAGWGKTVLLAGWARTAMQTRRVLWLSGETIGGTGLRSWLAGALPEAGVLSGANGDQRPSTHRPATAAGGPEHQPVVVIDDFHRIRNRAVLAEIGELVRSGGVGPRLLLVSRVDPDLPVHRWRLNGTVSELRPADLAFTVDESAQLLLAHGIDYSEAGLFGLHAATEGWAAGLRLAALSARTRPEPERAFADDSRFYAAVGDYLASEVIDPLPAEVQQFLLDTSITTQLSPGLVEALTGRGDGARILSGLSRASLFLNECAGRSGWYRYHPLFARTLYAALRRRSPERVVELHHRAAAWLGAHGLPGDALHQALIAGEWSQATDVVDRYWTDLIAGLRRRRPYDVVPPPPGPDMDHWLALAFAADRLQDGDHEGVRGYLRMADRSRTAGRDEPAGPAGTADRPGGPVEGQLRTPVAAIFRLAQASLFGDPHGVLDTAPRVLAPGGMAGGDEMRAATALSLGRARLRLGEWESAEPLLREALLIAQHTGMVHTQVSVEGHLAILDAVQGRLRAAARMSRQALTTAERFGLGDASDLAWTRLALAEVYYQWDRLAESGRLVDEALDLAAGDPDMLAFGEIIRARLRLARGQVAAALEVIIAARKEFSGAAAALVTALALAEAELRVAAGDLGAAARLVAEHAEHDAFAPWIAVLEASVLFGEGKLAGAIAIAVRVAEDDRASCLTWRVKAAILAALASRTMGDRQRVTRSLSVALAAAENEGFRRPFAAGGHAVRELLASYAPVLPVYHPVAADLATVPQEPTALLITELTTPTDETVGALVEPLTERELTVLRYLQGTMSNEEIASMLYVSVNTVKTHIKNIYRKLSAGRRREAVQRARELRLL